MGCCSSSLTEEKRENKQLLSHPPIPGSNVLRSRSASSAQAPYKGEIPGSAASNFGAPSPGSSMHEQRRDDSSEFRPGVDKSSSSSMNEQKNAFKRRAIALWDFAGDEEYEQIAFKAGDEIVVLEEDEESGWWWGELDGKEGYFPVNYTEVRKPDIKVNQDTVDPKIKALQASLVSQTEHDKM